MNACTCTLHSYFRTTLRQVDKELGEVDSRQLSRVIVVSFAHHHSRFEMNP